jgi:hypothetical protein
LCGCVCFLGFLREAKVECGFCCLPHNNTYMLKWRFDRTLANSAHKENSSIGDASVHCCFQLMLHAMHCKHFVSTKPKTQHSKVTAKKYTHTQNTHKTHTHTHTHTHTCTTILLLQKLVPKLYQSWH